MHGPLQYGNLKLWWGQETSKRIADLSERVDRLEKAVQLD